MTNDDGLILEICVVLQKEMCECDDFCIANKCFNLYGMHVG